MIKLLLAAGEQHERLPKNNDNSEEDSDNDFDYDYDDDDDDDGQRRKEVKELLEPELNLKHLCRSAIASHMLELSPLNLFCRVPQLGLPSLTTQYLLYYMSLVKNYDVEEEVGDTEDGEREEECNNDNENNDDGENEEAEDERDEEEINDKLEEDDEESDSGSEKNEESPKRKLLPRKAHGEMPRKSSRLS